MLSRPADHVERTLAHELTHAVLGDSWSLLPGSMEEGLADHVSVMLCDDGAARLSSACLATSGLEIDVEVKRLDDAPCGAPQGWSARVKLRGDTNEANPMAVFCVAAGLSSTKLDTGEKRGFYGLAYLVVERIVERDGYDGLHALCVDAAARGLGHVPVRDILVAADLDGDAERWRHTAARAMGGEELIELLRMDPDFLIEAVHSDVLVLPSEMSVEERLEALDVRVSVAGSDESVTLDDLPFVRTAVVDALSSTPRRTATQPFAEASSRSGRSRRRRRRTAPASRGRRRAPCDPLDGLIGPRLRSRATADARPLVAPATSHPQFS